MRKRPLIVKLLTASLFIVPFIGALLVYVGTRQHKVPVNPVVMTDLWLLTIGCCIAGYGVWKVRLWGFFLLLLLGAVIVGADLQQVLSNPKSINAWDFVDVIAVALAIGIIVQRHIRAPYFNPQIRWWERASRYRADIRAKFQIEDRNMDGMILDISLSGCFIAEGLNAKEGDVLALNMEFSGTNFTTPAKVVRLTTNPKGMGLMFSSLDRPNRKNLKQIIKTLTSKNTELAGPQTQTV